MALETTRTLYFQFPKSLIGYGLDGRGSIPDRGKIFLFLASRQTLGPIQPPINWAPGAISPAAKRPRREADHSPPSSAKDKMVDLYLHFFIYLHDVVVN
jgi:hypothetical protein